MAELSRDEMQRLARLGAQARLEEIRREESTIRRAFPELFRGAARSARGGSVSFAADSAAGTRRRPTMSAAMRKAVSVRMKKYWAERRKAKAAAAKGK